jgi:hypothetical protein
MANSILFPNNPTVIDHIVAYTAKVIAFTRERSSHFGPDFAFAMPQPPRREHVQELLELAFAASLEHEENRAVVFTLFYDETARLVEYTFKQPPPLTPGTLARLSAALDPLQTYICVEPSPKFPDSIGFSGKSLTY